MKKVLFLILLGFAAACSTENQNQTKKVADQSTEKDHLAIYAFHGTRQCATCKHMKAYTKSSLDKFFKAELKSGDISYQVVDVDDEANYNLAEKFEATGTALMISNVKNGKDNIEDWSDFAFEYANGDQNTYEMELKKMIEAKLK